MMVVLLALIGLVFALGAYALVKYPKAQVRRWQDRLEGKDLADVEHAARQTVVQLLSSIALMGALLFAVIQFTDTQRSTSDNLRITEQGQLTDRFARSIDQLGQAGSTKLAIRIGGIYALERIASDSPRDAPTIMDVLSAYVRAQVPGGSSKITVNGGAGTEPEPLPRPPRTKRPPADIAAVLRVIGRRDVLQDRTPINLSTTSLSRADLRGGDFRRVLFRSSDLRRATFNNADFTRADLSFARLAIDTGASLFRTTFVERATFDAGNLASVVAPRVKFRHSSMKRVILQRAHLSRAVFDSVRLTDAELGGADLVDSRFVHSDLRRADLKYATLTGATLERSNLEHARLADANCRGVRFIDTNLANADLRRADLTGADLRGARGLERQQLESAIVSDTTVLP